MSRHKKIGELLNFYVISAYQDILFEEEEEEEKEDSSEEEENELIILELATLLESRYLEERTKNIAKSKIGIMIFYQSMMIVDLKKLLEWNLLIFKSLYHY